MEAVSFKGPESSASARLRPRHERGSSTEALYSLVPTKIVPPGARLTSNDRPFIRIEIESEFIATQSIGTMRPSN
jgi:hypothetical protein